MQATVVQNVNRSVAALLVVPIELPLAGSRNLNASRGVTSLIDKAMAAVQSAEEWNYYDGAEVTQQGIYSRFRPFGQCLKPGDEQGSV